MEKYSKWRDQKSGIHPFIPLKSKLVEDDKDLLWKLKVWVVGPLFAIIKLPFVIIISLWLLIMTILSFVIPVAFLRRLFVRYTQIMGTRVLLFIMGFYWITTRYLKLGKNTKIPNSTPGSNIAAGDLIICNHVSYVDILYLSFRFSPIFAVPPTSWKESNVKGSVIPLFNIFSALWFSVNEPEYQTDDAIPLADLLQQAKQQQVPVVVFPEGCTTNGKVVLSCASILEGVNISPNQIHIVGLRYEFEDFSPTFSVGRFPLHFFQLVSQLRNSLEVRYLPTVDVPAKTDAHSFLVGDDGDLGTWGDAVCGLLSSVLKCKRAQLTTTDKREFKAYWFGHREIYKKRD